MAATTAAIMRMIFCDLPLKFENHFATFSTAFDTLVSAGVSVLARADPIFRSDCVTVLLSFSKVSDISRAPSIASPERIRPMSSASSPYCLKASPPSSIMPDRSEADLPKSSCATMSLWVSFSICERACRHSYQTSCESLNSPFASVISTPSVSKTSDPELILDRSFLKDPVMSSTETSTSSEAYCIFCSSSTEIPVLRDRVASSSAVLAALPILAMRAPPTAAAAADSFFVFSAAFAAFSPNLSRLALEFFSSFW